MIKKQLNIHSFNNILISEIFKYKIKTRSKLRRLNYLLKIGEPLRWEYRNNHVGGLDAQFLFPLYTV